MKVRYFVLIMLLIVSACSTPKYTASFKDYHKSPDFSYVNKSEEVTNSYSSADAPVALASISDAPAEMKTTPSAEPSSFLLTKKEKKEAIKTLRSDLKEYKSQLKQQTKNAELEYQDFKWDNDLKLAAIFGAAGLVGVLLGGISVVFSIIGGIALIIAVIFFVQWVIRQ